MAVSAPSTPFPKYGDHRDRALAARAGRGDERAFAELYDRHAPGLLAFAAQYVGDRAAAEDVVQQTFMAAYRVLRDGAELEHPRAWLYRVTRNNALTAIRDRGPASVDADLAADLQDRAAAVPAQVERREALQAVVRDIVALPAEQRAALALYELGDLSQAEIADALGCKPARVKALVFQARSSLVTQRDARDASCETVRAKLATFHGGALNHRLIRHHLRGCPACTAYREELRDQRRRVALLLPVLPLPPLRDAVIGLFGGGGGAAAAAASSHAGAAVLLRAGRARRLAAGTAATAAAAGIAFAAWPRAEAPHERPAAAAAAPPSIEPASGPRVQSPPARRRRPAQAPKRTIHAPRQQRPVRIAAPAPVPAARPAPPNPPAKPPRTPAVEPKPVAKPPPPAPPPPTPLAQPPPAPAAAQVPAAPAPAPSPPPATCIDHSHASPQGMAHGNGHHKCASG